MIIWLAPLLSLFDIRFYKKATRTPASQGFIYVFYLAAILAVLATGAYAVLIQPRVHEMLRWIEKEMPPLAYSAEGFVMNAPSPYVMTHEHYGKLVVFDMEAQEPRGEYSDVPFYITAKKIFIENPDGTKRAVNVVRAQNTGRVAMINEVFKRVAESLAGFLVVIFFTAVFTAGVMLYFMAGLLFSMLAALINLWRKNRLPYSSVLSLTLFALTPALYIHILKLLPGFSRLHGFGFYSTLLLITAYLFMAVKLTEEPGPSPKTGKAFNKSR